MFIHFSTKMLNQDPPSPKAPQIAQDFPKICLSFLPHGYEQLARRYLGVSPPLYKNQKILFVREV